MSRCSKVKILFCIKILVGLFNVIVSNGTIFDNMTIEERRNFFGTEDGSIPEFQIVRISVPGRTEKKAKTSLEITFNYFGTVTDTILSIVDDHDLISQKTTGIWFAESDSNAYHNVTYTPRPDVLDLIGKYDFFQNADDGSAVTRFWYSSDNETFTGILKQNYTIKSVPRRFKDGTIRMINEQIVNDKQFSVPAVVFKIPDVPQEYFRRQTQEQNSMIPGLNLHRTKRQTGALNYIPSVVYPKLLLAPPYHDHSLQLQECVRQLIAHMNAVDMVYRQLRNPEVRLHISGIIIPRDAFATPYVPLADNENLISHEVLSLARTYFKNERFRFPFHNYDVVVPMTTSYFKKPKDSGGENAILTGLSISNSACDRVKGINEGGVVVVKYAFSFESILTMAHELGHAFGAGEDGEGLSAECKYNDVTYTMVAGISPNSKLKWSTCSQRAFSSYFRREVTSCTYNRPIEVSDAVMVMQGQWLSIEGQCQNLHNQASPSHCMELQVQEGKLDCRTFGCVDSKGRCNNTEHRAPMFGSMCLDGKRCMNQWCEDFFIRNYRG